jgi:hypothetical protein
MPASLLPVWANMLPVIRRRAEAKMALNMVRSFLCSA